MKNTGTWMLLILLSLSIKHVSGQDKNFPYKDLTNDTLYPLSIEKINQRYFITFEKTYFGKLQLTLHSPQKDTVYVALGEKKTSNNSVDTDPPGTVRFLTDSLIIEEGEHTYLIDIPDFEPPAWAANSNYYIPLPPEVGNIIPFRYVDIMGYSGTLQSADVQQIGYFYPFNESASSCQTSSDTLNKIWELCKHSMKSTTYCGVYVDGDRERRPYEADAYINQLSHYVVDTEYAIARKTIDHLAENPTWPSEWLHHMPMMLWEDYMYTGDKEYLQKYYQHYADLILDLSKDSSGLVVNDNDNDIIDWPKVERDGYQLGNVNNVPNAFYYNSLNLLSKIAEVLGNDNDAKALSYKALKLKTEFNRAFWNEDTGLYVDAVEKTHSSIHANIFPVFFGLADQNQIDSLLPFVENKGMATSVYGAQYLLDMLYTQNQADEAFALLTAHHERSWMHMIDEGSTITWEAWNEDVKSNLDWNHAWGAAPGNIIARRIFGIRPLTAGFDTACIEPQLNGLTYGSIKHPTINGTIEVDFKKAKNGKLQIQLKNDMPAMFVVPVNYINAASIKLNKKSITPKSVHNQMVIYLEKGKNSILLKKR